MGGHKLERLESSFWRGDRWTETPPEKAVQHVLDHNPLRLRTPQGEHLPIASADDLIEAHVLCEKAPPSLLPSPVLAAGLMTLGTLQRGGQPVSTYEAYNQLTGDPNHKSERPLTFARGDLEVPLASAEDVATAAYLAADFGDGTGVAPEAVQVMKWAKLQVLSDPLQSYYGDGKLNLHFRGVPLTSLERAELSRPGTAEAVQERCEQMARVYHAAGESPTWGQSWQLLETLPERLFSERLELLEKLPTPELLQLGLERQEPDVKLIESAAPLLRVMEAVSAETAPEVLDQAARHLAGLAPQSQPGYLGLVGAGLDPSLSLRVVSSRVEPESALALARQRVPLDGLLAHSGELPPELAAGPWLEDQVGKLMRSGLQPDEAAALMARLLESKQFGQAADLQARAGEKPVAELLGEALSLKRLASDGPLLELSDSPETYRALATAVPPEHQKNFLAIHAACEKDLTASGAAWSAIHQDTEHLDHRLAAWRELRAGLKPEQATAVLRELSGDPRPGVRQLNDLLPVLGGDVEKAREAATKLGGHPFAGKLFGLKPEAGGALLAARYVERRDLPGSELALADRQEALFELASAHEGNFRAATQDYLFIASSHADALPAAAGLMSEMVRATGSSREARLAFESLSQLDPEQAPELYPALRTALAAAGSVAEAWPLWQAIKALPPGEASARLSQLDGAGFGCLPPTARTALAAGQLVSPLDKAGLEALQATAGKLSGLDWEPLGSWRRLEDGSLEMGPGQGNDVLLSGPIKLPQDGRFELTMAGDWELPASSPLRLQVSTDGVQWSNITYAGDTARCNLEKKLPVPDDLAGKTVRFRMAQDTLQGAGRFRLERLHLDEVKVHSTQSIPAEQMMQIGDVERRGTTTFTSPDLDLPAGTNPHLTLSHFTGLRGYANTCHVEVQRQGSTDWERIHYHSGGADEYHSGPVVRDLSSYAGDTIRYRYRFDIGDPDARQYLKPSVTLYEATLVNRQADQSKGLNLDLFSMDDLDPMALARLATDPARSAEQRARQLEGLSALIDSTGSSGKAWTALEQLAPQADHPDFVERCRAFGYLQTQPEPLAALEKLTTAQRPGDRLGDLARLSQALPGEQLARFRQKLEAEGGEAQDVRALAESSLPPEAFWSAISAPVAECDLPHRRELVGELARTFGADGLELWNRLLSWREPGDDAARSARALTRLGQITSGQTAPLLQAVDLIQAARRDGLTTRSTQSLLEALANKLLLEGNGIEGIAALIQSLALEREASSSQIIEEGNRLILPGTTLARRTL